MTELELEDVYNRKRFGLEIGVASDTLLHNYPTSNFPDREMQYRPVTTFYDLCCYQNEVWNIKAFGLPQQVTPEEAMPWTKKAKLSK